MDPANPLYTYLLKCVYVYPYALPRPYVPPPPRRTGEYSFLKHSIPLHFSELEYNNICVQHFDILGFCETKLTSDIENLFNPTSYL